VPRVGSLFIIAFVVSVLQLTAVALTRSSGYAFNLPIIVLVFFGFRKGLIPGFILGIFLGILNGLFTIGPFWLQLILFSCAGLAVGYIGKLFYKENLITFIVAVFFSVFVIYFLYLFLRPVGISAYTDMLDCVRRMILPAAFFNMLISMVLFYFLRELKV